MAYWIEAESIARELEVAVSLERYALFEAPAADSCRLIR